MNIRNKLHYAKRSLGLISNFAFNGYIHCNLQITHRCNFKCEICDFWKVEHLKERELTLSEITVISEKLSAYGTLVVSLAGGEPMIREDLLEIIRIIARHHFPIMITNGWYITHENAQSLWRAGLQEVSVSIDYLSPGKHDRQRGMEGSFDKGIEALKLLKQYRITPRNRVHMISVLMDDNVDDIEQLIDLSHEIGVTYMVNLYSYQRGKKNERLPARTITPFLLQLKKQHANFVSLTAYINKLDDAIQNGGIGNCQAGKYYMNIDNYGNVARCTEMTDMPVGNILQESPASIKKKLYEAQKDSTCSQCWTSCRGWAESMHGKDSMLTWKEFYISVKDHE
ncbi:MAG: hypothetical protein A2Y62_14450 [Candidatus Fischerbacteria bacterium RBG_13_37_8]|uniref:Radical SAM core domain-containing protein n=1 Tax=Candidatus Fischerbacteria bacterium RBG_13_37_8 TaxID=1817863 RepID=A0A1F5VNN9_9BACT|nr:MAG: hypothetical protein A2Y62_14450 [Candidatus Fischerbacteria bacterium RBG_13_37_8]